MQASSHLSIRQCLVIKVLQTCKATSTLYLLATKLLSRFQLAWEQHINHLLPGHLLDRINMAMELTRKLVYLIISPTKQDRFLIHMLALNLTCSLKISLNIKIRLKITNFLKICPNVKIYLNISPSRNPSSSLSPFLFLNPPRSPNLKLILN